eukprot:2202399-Amphidinium_carterae.1
MLEQTNIATKVSENLRCEVLQFEIGSFRCFRPLMPFDGSFPHKQSMVGAINEAATLLCLPTKRDGVNEFAGHTLRVTGPQYLARGGLDLGTIRFLARWSSNVFSQSAWEAYF